MSKEKHTDNMLEKINTDFAEMRKALESNTFSEKALSNLEQTAEIVELQAYKTKFTLKLRALAQESPQLSSKSVLDQMFALLPQDISPSFLPVLAAHVVERWEGLTKKGLAA